MPWYLWLATVIVVGAIVRTAWNQASNADAREALPPSDTEIRRRINEREITLAIARRRVEELGARNR